MAAALFATAGRALASSSESTFGMQTVGPVITTKQNAEVDKLRFKKKRLNLQLIIVKENN